VHARARGALDERARPVLGSTHEIREIVQRHGVEDLIVAITALDRDELLRLYEEVDPLPVHLRLSSGLYELLTTRVAVRTLGTVPLMSLQKNRLHRGEVIVKTALESTLAVVGLALLFPVLLAIAVWIRVDSPGSVFYRRRVLGACGKQFDAFKFRTMHVNGDELLKERPEAADELRLNHKLKDDPRITRAGRWLRKYSLDEAPQLLNVLLGQMSLVGPRMITPDEGEKYGRQRMNLLSVKPGITGLWQVSGRSDLSYEERVRIDMYYVRNYSVWLDLQILLIQTLPAVLNRRGAY
jgi:exopolysaccharide biosynthesis polyprenyl glycosylphosphotransferase